ncbi:hypothetical protein Bxe_C0479 [Paraburkholderia xenovorans LB400]|uniref:Uncharacterized protein n=1 Tax=Paraburkholderia xenovorans (strain LB400) TaxID=266265 RepID=Q13HQ6_PARXL|nr:hypothetical protein Bxe_C0479 [Paraburkholderia xenovorans LB400]
MGETACHAQPEAGAGLIVRGRSTRFASRVSPSGETAVPRITVAVPVTGANGVTAWDESGDRAMAIAADERIPGGTAAGSSQGACLLQ